MGRKTLKEVCKICGGQARKINYTSRAKGKTYHYSKYVHVNGVVHYFREMPGQDTTETTFSNVGKSVFDSLEEIVNSKMQGRELRFGEIRSLLEESSGRSVSTATIYRNINKLLKLDMVRKRVDGGVVLYSGRTDSMSEAEMEMTKMSMGFDFSGDETSVTVFAHIRNLGLRMITAFPLSLPVGVIDSLDQIGLNVFDETRRITLSDENISYSYAYQTGISIALNRPLRKLEEENFFLNYSYKFGDKPIKIIMPSDVRLLRVSCEILRGEDAVIKKRLVDGLREIEPLIVRRTGSELGHITIETEFENVLRGDTIVISVG